jgi:nicotinamide mononucleotide transporter
MVFSILATWMLAQKILENWLYWMVIDAAAITLYWSTGYHVTIILFTIYVILSGYGYFSWRNVQGRCIDGSRAGGLPDLS